MKKEKKSKRNLCKIFLAMILLLPGVAFSQSREVKGIVSEAATGEPLVGVSVTQKGTANTAITDVAGNFTITVPADATLVFSFVGFASEEVQARSTTINVQLQEAISALDEVVVVGYGTMRKADLTTAVASVSADEWADRPIISAQQALQGKAAGVQITQPSGRPGGGVTIRVRGATSLNAGNDPLYVVDGIPTNNIDNVSPSDIESMQVLKDASSAAIYGSRAANGVVLITTKTGSVGKTTINFSTYAGFSNVSRQIKTLNTGEYYDLMDEIGITFDRTNTHYTDWAKEMYGMGMQQNYQLSVSGGTEKTHYYISGGYQQDEGVIAPSAFDRYTFRSNVSSEIKKWVKVNSNLSFSRTNTTGGVGENNNSGRGGVILSILNTPPFMTTWDPADPTLYSSNPYQSSWPHPVQLTDGYDRTEEYRFMGKVELDFTIIKGLHFKPSFSIDYSTVGYDWFTEATRTLDRRRVNGSGGYSDDKWVGWVNENILSYTTTFNENHHLTAFLGFTMQRQNQRHGEMSVEDFVQGTSFDRQTLNMANKINSATAWEGGYALMSYIGRVQYDYKSRYLFTVNFRADGSSKLYDKWGYFPSVSAGWRFSDEAFFEPLKDVINDSKLRIGYGQNGNQNGIGNYDFYDKFTPQRHEYPSDTDPKTGPQVTRGQLGNRDLRWEKTTQYNLGLDLSLFNSRLTAEFDVYYKKTTDLLLGIQLPNDVGVSLPLRNDGEMTNKGFEFNLNGRILTGDFKWDAGLNMSFNRNELSKLGLTKQFTMAWIESNGSDIIMLREGLPFGSFYGYIVDGIDSETGDVIYHDFNGNGVDPSDRRIIGCAEPDFTFGFTNNFEWKNFTLTAFFNGSVGNDIYNAARIETEGMFDSKNQSVAVLERWKRPGMITNIPRATDSKINVQNSTRFVEDGSYLRLKSLTLAYNFKFSALTAIGVSKLTLYATANNLFTLTKYKGYDPELNWADGNAPAQLGIDYGAYPQTRSFIFGANITF
jgi:TonB-linked SusC/RagA family outer membrane protein